MLGYPTGKAMTNAYFGPGNGSIWKDDLRCTGNESSIFDCDYGGWGLHSCSHLEDAGVECGPGYNPILCLKKNVWSTNRCVLSTFFINLRQII